MSLIWNTEDCYGKPITWYRKELIDKIKERLHDECSSTARDVLELIKEAEND